MKAAGKKPGAMLLASLGPDEGEGGAGGGGAGGSEAEAVLEAIQEGDAAALDRALKAHYLACKGEEEGGEGEGGDSEWED